MSPQSRCRSVPAGTVIIRTMLSWSRDILRGYYEAHDEAPALPITSPAWLRILSVSLMVRTTS